MGGKVAHCVCLFLMIGGTFEIRIVRTGAPPPPRILFTCDANSFSRSCTDVGSFAAASSVNRCALSFCS